MLSLVSSLPTLPCDLAALPDVWRMSALEARAERPTGFDAGFTLPGRVRGAMGHALLDRGGDPQAALARDALFGDHGAWRTGAELPKPFVVACQERGAELVFRLTLFGLADTVRTAAFDAFLAGLERGVAASTQDGAARRRLRVLAADWTRTETVAVPRLGLSARLIFRTPLRIGPRHALGLRWGDVIVSLAERAAGLARWQGMAVEPGLGRWREIANGLRFDDGGMRPVRWTRRSGAQNGRTIEMMGYEGALDIARPPEAIAPLLALGETMHVGGGAALGLGRFELA